MYSTFRTSTVALCGCGAALAGVVLVRYLLNRQASDAGGKVSASQDAQECEVPSPGTNASTRGGKDPAGSSDRASCRDDLTWQKEKAERRRKSKLIPETPIVVAKAAHTSQHPDVQNRLTIILTTSPVQSNPSTQMIEEVVGDIAHVPSLVSCKKMIVCDGCTVADGDKFRSGKVTKESLQRYDEYIERLASIVRQGHGSFANTTLLRMPSRHGFGLAVKAALGRVTTPYVMIMQHDRPFVASFPLPAVLAAMDADPALKYVGLHTGSTRDYAHRTRTKYKNKIKIEPYVSGGLEFLPMVFWYDSTHISTTEHYRSFVFGPRRLTKGNFIEADLGQVQIQDILAGGMEAHAQYGTWLLNDVDERVVCHINGRGYRTEFARPYQTRDYSEATGDVEHTV
eukprot:m.423289 g.423289  ORF g.423289 m.423289 type:complete len:398 (-) comp21332_c0_seq2:1701-2894(-)